ncbi:hypothetical protein ACIPY6_40990 [Streptomyces sp. NPDC090054]|uniref:hypothetical protein n=1 Tax=Streptomyces sp. NPDC090054 TaxID=3365933 RepID=UPI00381EC716
MAAVHHVLNERTSRAGMLTTAVVTCALLAGCNKSSAVEDYPGNAGLQGPGNPKGTSRIMSQDVLGAALPQGINLPRDVEGNGGASVHTWDMSNPAICQSEAWLDEECADALALGSSVLSGRNERIIIRLISFHDETTSKAHFAGRGTPDEVGANPPGDAIDGYRLPEGDGGWTGKGIRVRQGTAIATVEYAWAPGHEVPNRVMDLTAMVVERLEQSQSGKNPTASIR